MYIQILCTVFAHYFVDISLFNQYVGTLKQTCQYLTPCVFHGREPVLVKLDIFVYHCPQLKKWLQRPQQRTRIVPLVINFLFGVSPTWIHHTYTHYSGSKKHQVNAMCGFMTQAEPLWKPGSIICHCNGIGIRPSAVLSATTSWCLWAGGLWMKLSVNIKKCNVIGTAWWCNL